MAELRGRTDRREAPDGLRLARRQDGRTPSRPAPGIRPVIRTSKDPVHPTGGLAARRGTTSWQGRYRQAGGGGGGRAEAQRPCMTFSPGGYAFKAIVACRIRKGDVVVVRYEGPKGCPHGGHAVPDLCAGRHGDGQGGGAYYRRPVLGREPRFGHRHISPEAAAGGPIAGAQGRRHDRDRHPWQEPEAAVVP